MDRHLSAWQFPSSRLTASASWVTDDSSHLLGNKIREALTNSVGTFHPQGLPFDSESVTSTEGFPCVGPSRYTVEGDRECSPSYSRATNDPRAGKRKYRHYHLYEVFLTFHQKQGLGLSRPVPLRHRRTDINRGFRPTTVPSSTSHGPDYLTWVPTPPSLWDKITTSVSAARPPYTTQPRERRCLRDPESR